MNTPINDFTDSNASEPHSTPRATVPALLLAALALVASLLQLAFLDVPFFSYITIAVGVAYVAVTGKSLRPALILLAVAIAPAILLSTPVLGALAVALVVSLAAGALLWNGCRGGFLLPLLLSAVAFGTAYAVTKSLGAAILTLFPLPATVALAVAFRREASRTASVIAAIGGFLLPILVIIGGLIYENAGALNADTIRSSVDYVRNAVIALAEEMGNQYFALLLEQVNTLSNLTPEMLAAYEESVLAMQAAFAPAASISLAFDLLPAITVLLCGAVALGAQMQLCSAAMHSGLRTRVPLEAMRLGASVLSAVLFDVTFFVTLLAAGTLAGAVAQNLFLMLLPLFFAIGWRGLGRRFAGRRGCGRLFWMLPLLALLSCSRMLLSLLLYLVAFFGAGERIRQGLQTFFADRENKNGNRH